MGKPVQRVHVSSGDTSGPGGSSPGRGHRSTLHSQPCRRQRIRELFKVALVSTKVERSTRRFTAHEQVAALRGFTFQFHRHGPGRDLSKQLVSIRMPGDTANRRQRSQALLDHLSDIPRGPADPKTLESVHAAKCRSRGEFPGQLFSADRVPGNIFATKPSAQECKVRYTLKIGPVDFDTKTMEIIRHLHEGHRVRVAVRFRSREVLYPEAGQRLLRRIADLSQASGQVERLGELEGHTMEMVLIPRTSPPEPPPVGVQ